MLRMRLKAIIRTQGVGCLFSYSRYIRAKDQPIRHEVSLPRRSQTLLEDECMIYILGIRLLYFQVS